MIRRPPRSTRTDTLFPYTTLFRSRDLREIGVGQRGVVAQYGGAEQRVLELADIARPVIVHQQPDRVVGDPDRAQPRLLGDPREQVARERGNVAGALAQRRDRHLDDVEPVIESLAEPPRLEIGSAAGRERVRQYV